MIAADPRSRAIKAVVPVPLHSTRRRERGFNQSEILALAACAALGLAGPANALSRLTNTPSQTRLSRIKRQQNVAQAFTSQEWAHPPTTVLLIDDVQTTGATLSACTNALLEAGVSRVYGAVVALAELES